MWHFGKAGFRLRSSSDEMRPSDMKDEEEDDCARVFCSCPGTFLFIRRKVLHH